MRSLNHPSIQQTNEVMILMKQIQKHTRCIWQEYVLAILADPKIVYGCRDEVLHLFNVRIDEKLHNVAFKQFDREDRIRKHANVKYNHRRSQNFSVGVSKIIETGYLNRTKPKFWNSVRAEKKTKNQKTELYIYSINLILYI